MNKLGFPGFLSKMTRLSVIKIQNKTGCIKKKNLIVFHFWHR